MAGVSGSITVDVQAKLTGAADLGNPSAPVRMSKLISFLPGTADITQDDILWADTRQIAASSSENLDLAGVLAGELGGTLTFAEVTAIVVMAHDDNTNNVVLFGAASNPFNGPLSGTTPKHAVEPGEVFVATSKKGWPVVAATGDLLLVANSAAGSVVNYDIAIFGRTVAA